MSDLRDLYQEVILDHNRHPRNFGGMEAADRSAEGFNPLCGDKITVYLKLDGEVISDVRFEGSGCAISTAAASLMTETLIGKTLKEANDLFSSYHDLVTGKSDEYENVEVLGKLAVFGGVSEFPVRVKCATLCWHTIQAALNNAKGVVTTE